MRTTIELSHDHKSALNALAVQRGLRGYSKLIQEAIDLYLKENTKGDGVKNLLKMKGSWSEQEAKAFRNRLEDIRRTWKID